MKTTEDEEYCGADAEAHGVTELSFSRFLLLKAFLMGFNPLLGTPIVSFSHFEFLF